MEVWESEVTFNSPHGDTLAGVLTELPPTAVAAAAGDLNSTFALPFTPEHCAILCHGFASHKNGFHFPAIAAHLATKLGMSSLRFDYAGNMDSTGDFKFGGFMKEVEQMAAAKAYLEKQHKKRVVMVLGHSRGAINATLYSGKYGDIPLVILVAGRYDLTLNMTQRYGANVLQQLRETGPWQQVTKRDGDKVPIHWELTAEAMEERFALDMAGACQSISRHPPSPAVLIVHGAADPICELSDTQQLADSIAGSKLVVLEGANHWHAGKEQQLLQAVEAFVLDAWQQQTADMQQQQQQQQQL